MSLWDIVQGFLRDLLDAGVNEVLATLQGVFGDLFYISFFIEQMPGLNQTILTASTIRSAMNILYGFLVALLTVKLIWKGIKVYILWRDGEAETPPGEMLMGAAFALIVAVSFPLLYEMGVDIVHEIILAVCGAVFPASSQWNGDWVLMTISTFMGMPTGAGLLVILLGLVYIILFIWLLFAMLKQGGEMLIFRLGIPLAVIGLVDSDGGAWKPYSQTLFRQMATALVRYFCMALGVQLISSLTVTGMIASIIFAVIAVSTPTILSQFLTPKGGGGLTQKISTISLAIRSFGGK